MKYIISILITLAFSSIYGQTAVTSYSADLPAHDSLEISLIDIDKSDYIFYFRVLLSGQTVEIYSEDNKTYDGKIVNSIKEYDQVEIEDEYRTKATQLYTEKVPIETSKATSLARQIIQSGQLSIPTDTLIETWTRWYLHCESLRFEIKNDGRYFEQSFHCPWSQPDSVEFKDVILSNYDLLKRELKLDSIYHNFWLKLPKGKTYSRSGYGMTYMMTEEQEVVWKKDQPRRDYLKSIKDTIDTYLRIELDQQQIKLDNINCFEDYRLTFNENGKLRKLRVSNHNKPKLFEGLSWYFEDKRKIRKCKTLIKKVFREIDLSSFNLKYKVHRTLSFGLEGNVQLRDDTIY